MGGVDCGDHHKVMGVGFSNVTNLKNWYKKSFLGLDDLSFLQEFTAWNLEKNSQKRPRRFG